MSRRDWTLNATLEELLHEVGSSERVDVDTDFEARCREAFVQGQVRSIQRTARSSASSSPIRTLAPWFGLLAASVALVFGFRVMNADPETTPETRQGWALAGSATASAQAALATLKSGRMLSWDEDSLDVHFGDGLDLRLLEGTRLRGGLDEHGELALELAAGEILIRTIVAYDGPDLAVTTPQTEVRVTGTALSMMVNEEVTCVCVAEGTVEVNDSEDPRGWRSVHEHQTHIVIEDAQPYYTGEFYSPNTLLGDKENEHLVPLIEYAAGRQ